MASVPSYPDLIEENGIKPERISKNSLWILIGQIGVAFLSFITIFFMTRYLGPEKFGFYSTALSLVLVLLPFSDLGFDLCMIRSISADTSCLSYELSHTLSIKSLLAIITFGLMILVSLLLHYKSFVIGYVALLGIYLLIFTLSQSFIGAIRSIRKMRYESIALIIGRASTTLAIFVLIFLKASLTVIILAYLLGGIILFGAAYYFLKREIRNLRLFFSLSGWQARFKEAVPFGITAILAVAYLRVDTIILSKFQDAASVGLYNSAQNVISGSMMLASPLAVAIFPALAAVYQARREEAEQIFRKGMTFILLIGLPLGLGVALMAESLVKFAYGAKFILAIPLLTIVAIKIPIMFSTFFIGNSLGAIGYQKKVAIVAAVNVVFNIIMNLLLIPSYGAKAAAIITVCTELLGLIQYVFILRSRLNPKIFPSLARIIICSLAGVISFVIFKGVIGPWPSAAIFAIIYSALALIFGLVSISAIRDMIFSRSAA